MEAGDRLFNPLPLAGLGALQPFNGCLAVGATFVGMSRFDAAEAARLLVEERCTLAFPAIDALVGRDPRRGRPARALGAVAGRRRRQPRAAQVDRGARCPRRRRSRCSAATEAGGVDPLGQLDDSPELRLSSVGRPFHGSRSRSSTSRPASAARRRRGRIAVKGWSLFQGYHKDADRHSTPTATCTPPTSGRWTPAAGSSSETSPSSVRVPRLLKIGVPKETAARERRVALVPDVVRRLRAAEHEVIVEAGAGLAAGATDEQYVAAGAEIGDPWSAEVVAKVAPPSAAELAQLRAGTILVGFLNPLGDPEGLSAIAATGATALAMERIPRISRAQSMDALSLAGDGQRATARC